MNDEDASGKEPVREYYFKEGCYISEWWNTDEDGPVSVARVRIEPDVTTRLHRLNGVTERYFILSGNGRVEVDGVARDVGPGAVVMIPADATQRISNTGERDLAFLAVCTPRFHTEAYQDLEGEKDISLE